MYKNDVKVDGDTIYEIKQTLPLDANISAVTHNGITLTAANTGADQTYSYDPATGVLTIYTKSFSPFAVTYTLPVKAETVEELVNAVRTGRSVKLATDLVVGKGTNLTFEDDADIDLAGYKLTISGNASLKITSGELNIVDSVGTATLELNKGTIKAEGASAVLNIDNVEITMGTGINDKIQVIDGATFNMYEGKLVSTGEPCVYISGGTFIMYGGEIVVPASNGITCGSGTNAINLNGGKITVASGAIGINTMKLGSIYISEEFVFELADDTACSLFILNTQAPTVTGKEPANIYRVG